MTLVKIKKRPETPLFNLFDDFFGRDPFWGEARAARPAVNVLERPDRMEIHFAVPGMAKEDFTLNIDKNVLTVTGDKEEEKVEEDVRLTRREFGFSSFNRSFTLPDTVEIEKIGAKYENGILVIALPKREEAKQKPARTIKIA